MNKSDFERQMDFCKEIDKEKFVKRQTYISDGITKENDAEHAWHMAVMAMVLEEYSNDKIDLLKVISMILIHDIVEIDAGDTYAYDEQGKESQQNREGKAADRIFNILPEKQALKFLNLWKEFEAGTSAEARFARTLDNFQPVMLNNMTEGKSWEERGVKLSQILNRNKNTPLGSEKLWQYSYENFIKPNVNKGRIDFDLDEK